MLAEGGLRISRISPLYETLPVDCESGTPPFVNGTAIGEWSLGLRALFQLCKQIEVRLGRPLQHSSRAARPIDIDILLADGVNLSSADLTVPHPQVKSRLFVLVPLNDIAPEWVIPPDGTTVSTACERLLRQTAGHHHDKEPVKRLSAVLVPPVPGRA
jgi:2-amino-4-hydroxy-6-hydroxymethyldihydropteridine diphosphokinase